MSIEKNDSPNLNNRSDSSDSTTHTYDDWDKYSSISKVYKTDLPRFSFSRSKSGPKTDPRGTSEESEKESPKAEESSEIDSVAKFTEVSVQTHNICILSRTVANDERRFCFLVSLSIISNGLALAFPAALFEKFVNPSAELSLSNDEVSWLASVNLLTSILGVIISCFVFDSLGRKKTFIFCGIVNIISWLMIFLAFQYRLREFSIAQILIARAFLGISAGVISRMAMVFESEIAFTNLRGTLTVLPSLSYCLGMMLVTLFALLLQDKWEYVAFVCSGVCMVTTIAMTFIKDCNSCSFSRECDECTESNFYPYCQCNQVKSHPKTLIYLDNLEQVISKDKIWKGKQHDILYFMQNFKHRFIHKPIFILMGIFFFYQFSGTYQFSIYTSFIAESFNIQSNYVPYLVFILKIMRLLAGLLTLLCIMRIGRTYIFIFSGILMTLSLIGLAMTRIYLESTTGYIPGVILAVYTLSNALGFINLAHVLGPEIVPIQFRRLCASIAVILGNFLGFLLTKIFPYLVEKIGIEYVMIIFATFTFFSVIYVVIFVPETIKKSNEDIAEIFNK
ncbi:hypothetical protein DMENIID0001_088030 [Sergentomyia squamirostris]